MQCTSGRAAHRRLATLTAQEEKAWGFAFAYYAEDGQNDKQAAASAWADLQAEFPRLRDYDGARP